LAHHETVTKIKRKSCKVKSSVNERNKGANVVLREKCCTIFNLEHRN